MSKNGFYKKVLAGLLAGGMILSLASCGSKKEEAVLEYGGDKVDTTSISDAPDDGEESVEESAEETAAEGQTLKEFYGDGLKWDETLNVQSRELFIEINSNAPDLDSVNVYEIKSNIDDDADEEALVGSLFDSDAEKLDKLQYENENSFIPHLYKLRKVMREIDGDLSIDYSVIDASYDKVYEWTDTTNYALHMYKGKYQGIDYGLILAYDHNQGRKHIFFFPENIKDYFPDYDFQTLMMEGTEDLTGNVFEADNLAALSEDEVKASAGKFLEEKVGLGTYDSKLTNDATNYATTVAEMTILLDQMMGENSGNKDCMSQLSFSDGDFMSTYENALGAGNYRHNVILSEQRDLAKESLADTKAEYYMDDYIGAMYEIKTSGTAENVNIVRDGYAVYLDNPFMIDHGTNGLEYMVSGGQGNNGCVMVTSKGILGVDLEFDCGVVNVTEDVEILGFEKLKDTLKNELEEEIDLKEFGTNKKTIRIRKMDIGYYMITDEKEGKSYMVPGWEFEVYAGDRTGKIILNAMDGSIIHYHKDSL